MNYLRITVGGLILLLGFTGCTRGVRGGNPTGRLSDQKGTSQIFESSLSHVTSAITNSFDSHSYREMALIYTGGLDYEVHGKKFQGGYSLTCMSMSGSITNILLDNGTTDPYLAEFYIETQPVGTNRTKVTVYTISSSIIDGQKIGPHGGWAHNNRNVPPLRQEEENILAQIEFLLK